MRRLREIWLGVHRWVALGLGLFLALLGLSGALLELKGPILRWEVGAQMLQLAPGRHDAPLQQGAWIEAASTAYPQLQKVFGAAAPRQGFLESDNAIVFGALRERPGTGIAMIDPYSAQPRGFFVFEDLWLARLVALHRSLLLPPAVGSLLVLVCGLALLVSVGSGLYLWWPGRRSWWKAASLRPGSTGNRRLREWHNVAAAWLCLPLALIAGSGAWLARPELFTWLTATPMAAKPLFSAAHGHLLLGTPGAWLAFLCGISLPLLYITGLLLWWRKRASRRAVQSFKETSNDTP
ncbi:MAG: PepSY-associated TM helix domain-containing protein [Pseudomonas sp.]|uniref:PepSY-associated TM helix domain-containing protein n=1 Tax=Pseudomonas sp. TaxID=306 RepID=UPI0007311752|nr:peptidase [Pseudomonas sp. ABAC61]